MLPGIAHTAALEELYSLGRSGVQLITYHCKNRAHRSEADLPQNTPGQSTPLTQQLCFLPLKWRSLISLFPGFLLPTSSASARLSNRLRAFLHTGNTQVRPRPRPQETYQVFTLQQNSQSDAELWAEKPSNSRPSQHGPWSLSKGQGCTRKLLSVKCSAAGTAAISNHQGFAQNMGSPKFGINFCLFFLHKKRDQKLWANASPWEKGQEKETWKDTSSEVVALFRQPEDKTLGTALLFNRAELWFIRHLKASYWPCRQFQKTSVCN